jgi:hypothetical protein
LKGVNQTPRVLDVIDTVWSWCQQNRVPVDSVYIDTNEMLALIFRGKRMRPNLKVNLCKTSSTYYSFKQDRCLIGMDHGGLLGFNAPAIRSRAEAGCAKVTDHQARTLFGNSLALPHISLIIAAAIMGLGDIFKE